eukprot:15330575-Ditylum_brightwellii.AAC.1
MVVDKKLEHNCLVIAVVDKEVCTAQIINIVVPFDTYVVQKTVEKITKYRDLKITLEKNWGVNKIQTIQIIAVSFVLGTTHTCTCVATYPNRLNQPSDPALVPLQTRIN